MQRSSIFIATFLLASTTALSIAAADPKAVWEKQCQKCHGADGKGQTTIGKKLGVKDYTDAAVQSAVTDDQMFKVIKSGSVKDGKTLMKAAENLSDGEIRELVAHVRRFGPAPVVSQTESPSGSPSTNRPTPAGGSTNRIEIAAIYFPGFHRDDHYDSWFGEGWNEWKLLAESKPRFPGHRFLQPDWGAFDEADPAWMQKQIDLAAGHGIDVFIFDWYWYSGVKILHRPLEDAFLRASNRQKLKYALMWANHDWRNVFPAPLDNKQTLWLPSRVTPGDFERHIAYCIGAHFGQTNYWRVDGALYFSVFESESFVQQLGGADKARLVVDRARRQVEEGGLGKLHLAAFAWQPAQIPVLRDAGFDSITTYTMTASGKVSLPETGVDEYTDVVARHEAFWKEMDSGVLPYAPVVTVGWDPSPRWAKDCAFPPPNIGYPYSTVVINNTPEAFGALCRKAREHCESSRLRPPAIVVNAWNEWTEGSALLPEREYKTGFLEALQKAFDR